jgi:hypothetical protein
MALHSIPQELSMYASGMLTLALVSNNILTTNKLIPFICKEADCIKSQSVCDQKPQGGGPKTKDAQQDEALVATSSRGGCQCKGNCNYCSKPSH